MNLLGTVCTITLYGGGRESDLEAAFQRLRQIEERMSVNREDSEVSRVNAAAGSRAVAVSPDTFSVIREGLERSRAGDGWFDVTVGPLVRLWGIGTGGERVPSPEEIRGALSRVNYRLAELDEGAQTVRLGMAGMALDLGGIAKGYAADEAARILSQRGVRHALIDLGGNILTLGLKPDGAPWRIGVQDPEKARGAPLGVLTVGPGAVVTSGVYERFFESGGVRYHHLMDTRTGYPARSGLLSVTVVTEKAIRADGSTSLAFILGLERGRAYIEGTPGLQAVFVTEKHEVYVTPALRASFRLTSPDYQLAGW